LRWRACTSALKPRRHNCRRRHPAKIGDYHYYGRAGLAPDARAAAKAYTRAAERRLPQAIFNVGWMYAVGRGVRQDFVLAKRNYDLAAQLDADVSWGFDVGSALGVLALLWAVACPCT
jgi:hypothetical protein